MRKLTITEFMSLDGVIENPQWTFKYWNDEIAGFKTEESSHNEALLLGRITYEGFASAWPNRKDEDPGAAYFNGTRKYVVSNTLEKADWNNSVIIKGNAVEAITQLKQQDGPDLVVHGSANLAQTLMQNNLVDTYRLLVYPVVLSKGKRLFEEGSTPTLKLVSSRNFNGVLGLVYEPA
jgi:dihydrofolate reductase